MNLDSPRTHDVQTFSGLGKGTSGHITRPSEKTPINYIIVTPPTILSYKKTQAAVRRLGLVLEGQEPGGSTTPPPADAHLEGAPALAQADDNPAPA